MRRKYLSHKRWTHCWAIKNENVKINLSTSFKNIFSFAYSRFTEIIEWSRNIPVILEAALSHPTPTINLKWLLILFKGNPKFIL